MFYVPWVANIKERKSVALHFLPLKLCTPNLPKLDQDLSLIMSFPRNMAFRPFVITPLVILHRRRIKYQPRWYNFPAPTSQTNMFSAFWDKRACRWMTPGCDVWAEALQPLTDFDGAFPPVQSRPLHLQDTQSFKYLNPTEIMGSIWVCLCSLKLSTLSISSDVLSDNILTPCYLMLFGFLSLCFIDSVILWFYEMQRQKYKMHFVFAFMTCKWLQYPCTVSPACPCTTELWGAEECSPSFGTLQNQTTFLFSHLLQFEFHHWHRWDD